jgi:hypothetical protein
VSGGPAIGIAGAGDGTSLAISGGVNLPIVRVGYQFAQMDQIGLGIFAEPRLAITLWRPFDIIATNIELAGSFALQLNIGKYFWFAAGLSVGGYFTAVEGATARGPVMGGFLLRIGCDLLLERRMGRPTALSLAIEALPLFSHYSNGFVDGTTSFTTIGFSVGFDSY